MAMRFSDIRSYEGSQNTGFEELVCQIARRSPPTSAKEFRRIEGAGGDGGVEAYWIRNDGTKAGYQAKFFLATKYIDWVQVDKSVKTALDTHKELKEYVIAFACDLTDRSGEKGFGKRGWEHWETHKEKWDGWAAERSMSLTFMPWIKSEIFDRLSLPEYSGLAWFWFDVPRFNQNWFSERFEEVVADLDERYHPEDHVPVAIGKLFEGLARSPKFLNGLKDAFSQAPSTTDLIERFDRLTKTIEGDLRDSISSALDPLREFEPMLSHHPYDALPVDAWKSSIQDAEKVLGHLQSWLWDSERDKENPHKDRSPNYQLTVNRNALRDAFGKVLQLQKRLDAIDVLGDLRRGALIVGDAGIGKSHLVADAVSRQIKREGPAILILGQYFSSIDPWDTIRSKLGITDHSADEFLQALDAAAEAQNLRCLFVIDALNDAQDLQLWRSNIAGFVTKIKRFENIAIILTCRPEYVDALVPNTCLKTFRRVECRGFQTADEQENAARQYLEKRGIVRPATPWLTPEFSNPLFLRTCCEALNKAGEKEFPRGLRGTASVFRFYLDSMRTRLINRSPDITFPPECVSKGLLAIAQAMAGKRKDHVSREEANEHLETAFRCRGPDGDKSWINVLCSEGALRLDHEISSDDDPFNAEFTEVFRFAYQRFSDHLIVAAILKKVDELKSLFGKDGEFDFLTDKGELNWDWVNLLPALSQQIPEKFKQTELADVLPKNDKGWWSYNTIQEAFAESILWRDKSAFYPRTLKLFNDLADENWDPRLGVLLKLAVI